MSSSMPRNSCRGRSPRWNQPVIGADAGSNSIVTRTKPLTSPVTRAIVARRTTARLAALSAPPRAAQRSVSLHDANHATTEQPQRSSDIKQEAAP